jgi:TRAP-type C4-dicarboxylate transport system permease small subunit
MDMHNVMLSVRVIQQGTGNSPLDSLVFLYLGPETVLPLASIVATIVGIVLIFWRSLFKLIRKPFKRLSRKQESQEPQDPEIT